MNNIKGCASNNFYGADLSKNDLVDSNFENYCINNVNLSNSNIKWKNIEKCKYQNLRMCNLSYNDLSDSDFNEYLLIESNLSNTNIKWSNIVLCKYRDLSKIDLSGNDLSDAKMKGYRLADTNLRDSKISATNLKNCKVTIKTLDSLDIPTNQLKSFKTENIRLVTINPFVVKINNQHFYLGEIPPFCTLADAKAKYTTKQLQSQRIYYDDCKRALYLNSDLEMMYPKSQFKDFEMLCLKIKGFYPDNWKQMTKVQLEKFLSS